MLLAGGRGSRLYVLTENVAKPAVPFGGKYRIIDFPLSNCVNSGIDTVGVLTQYEPHALNAYLANGQTWDLDRLYGGVYALPPYEGDKGSEWYKGTANAIYQNIAFIDEYDPEYVLVLSGDHIYKMDYDEMLDIHKEKNAAATIAVLDVSYEEAKRFGILNCHPDGTIYEFEEKPAKPKSTLASMGIYIFTWAKLRQYLIDDENDPNSSNDFGKNIIPAMLNKGENLQTYRFDGYWKDVGTIESLWEANMDLLSPDSGLNLNDPNWKIYGRTNAAMPHFSGKHSEIRHSLLAEGCEVEGKINNSVLFSSVIVEEGADVDYSVIMPGAVIEAGAVVKYAIVAENAHIRAGAVIGNAPEEVPEGDWGVAVIAAATTVGKNAVVAAKEMVDKDVPDAE
jgi:glucose-1-phosphate adenylyltransferase